MITIGLVAYNRPQFISRAINSVLNQTFKEFQLVISDDSSNDDIAKIINSKYLGDNRITYIRRPRIGMTNNFVATMLDCSTKYFIWLCDDDYLSEDYLEKSFNFLEANRDYSLVCGKTRFFDSNGVIEREELLELECENPLKRVIHYFKKVESNIILYGLMRREEIFNFFYPDTFGADLFWSVQVAYAGKVKILKDTFFYYSKEGISSDTNNLAKYYKNSIKVKNPYKVLRKVAFNIIFKRKGAFCNLNLFTSKVLAIKVWVIIRDRFCLSPIEAKIRSKLRLRSRLKALMA